MRIVTGGHAIWMGGWTTQVHHHRDIIDPTGAGPLYRDAKRMKVLLLSAIPYAHGELLLPPAMALADGLVHRDHRIMPPDEIDPDYLDRDERPGLRLALENLEMARDEIDRHMDAYDLVLAGEESPGFR